MPKVTINTHKSLGDPGSFEMHYGYVCEVGPEGQLVADVPEDMLQNELDAKRVTLVEEKDKKVEDTRTKAELQAVLDGLGIKHTANMNKAELLALIPAE